MAQQNLYPYRRYKYKDVLQVMKSFLISSAGLTAHRSNPNCLTFYALVRLSIPVHFLCPIFNSASTTTLNFIIQLAH